MYIHIVPTQIQYVRMCVYSMYVHVSTISSHTTCMHLHDCMYRMSIYMCTHLKPVDFAVMGEGEECGSRHQVHYRYGVEVHQVGHVLAVFHPSSLTLINTHTVEKKMIGVHMYGGSCNKTELKFLDFQED